MSAIIESSSDRVADDLIKGEQNRKSDFDNRKYDGVPSGFRTPCA
jgi:hypothetical protein